MWRPLLLPILVVLLLALASPGAAAGPNHSILLWKPGKAVTGTLKHRIYTKVDSFALRGVDLAAASRSSLALYTRSTGRLRTGTFRRGAYAPVESMTVRSGFTHAAASCDSLVLYNRTTGRYLMGTLINGRFRNRSSGFLDAGAERIAATCDALVLWDVGVDLGTVTTFAIGGGDLRSGNTVNTVGTESIARLATTSDSYMFLVETAGGLFGGWGIMDAQHDPPFFGSHSSSAFVPWAIIAGTADSLLFYNPDGAACRWWLVNGDIAISSCAVTLPKGFTVIAGGK